MVRLKRGQTAWALYSLDHACLGMLVSRLSEWLTLSVLESRVTSDYFVFTYIHIHIIYYIYVCVCVYTCVWVWCCMCACMRAFMHTRVRSRTTARMHTTRRDCDSVGRNVPMQGGRPRTARETRHWETTKATGGQFTLSNFILNSLFAVSSLADELFSNRLCRIVRSLIRVWYHFFWYISCSSYCSLV